MCDAVSALEDNLEGLLELLAAWRGWRVHHSPGLFWCESPIPHEAFNKVVRFQLSRQHAASRLARLRDRAFSRHAPLGFWLGPRAQPQHLRDLLRELGFSPVAQAWGMTLTLHQMPPTREGSPVAVEPLRDRHRWPEWVRVFGETFGTPPSITEAHGEQLGLFLGQESPLTHFAALTEGQVVGIASLFFANPPVAGLYNFGVAQAGEGHGVGQALLAGLLAFAWERGYRQVVLRSTAHAYGFYLRQGFHAVAKYELWVARPTTLSL
ncbi:MAG: GNAT family N-acetyltransferase [Thermoanaerobaculum sp.]|nr:GNAT family N-acetyltransferase [Thermoanaerobaculum sp.]MDW7967041.1 GNAT family N-acetyltransferase [Thermoanaerobaculum sp.]